MYVRTAAHGASEEAKQPDESKLDEFRGYISAMKHASFSIPTEMSDVRADSSHRSRDCSPS